MIYNNTLSAWYQDSNNTHKEDIRELKYIFKVTIVNRVRIQTQLQKSYFTEYTMLPVLKIGDNYCHSSDLDSLANQNGIKIIVDCGVVTLI